MSIKNILFTVSFSFLLVICIILIKWNSFDTYNTKIDKIKIDKLDVPYISKNKVNEKKLFTKKFMDSDIQKENLTILAKLLDSHNIAYFIDCGTLLGCIRENSFIKGDTDADISTSLSGLKKIRSIADKLENLGFIIFRNNPNSWMAMSLLRKGEYIDVYNHFNDIPFDLIRYNFLDYRFPIPKYYDDWLTEIYGNWRVPDPNGKGDGSWEKGMKKYVKNHPKDFDIIRDIINFRYKPADYQKWVKNSNKIIDESIDLTVYPTIFSIFDYIKTPFTTSGSLKKDITKVLWTPQYTTKTLKHPKEFDKLQDITTNKRVLVVMGEDTLSNLLCTNSKQILMKKFSTIFWEANNDKDFLTLPMGLNASYVSFNIAFNAENAIKNIYSQETTKKYLLCIPQWNKFSTTLVHPSRKRITNFVTQNKNVSWFHHKNWEPDQYYLELSKYKYAVCPTGNGIQTPKIFEALLVQTIPIVENEFVFRQLKHLGLPIMIVNNWSELSPEYLLQHEMKVDWKLTLYLCSTKGVIDIISNYLVA